MSSPPDDSPPAAAPAHPRRNTPRVFSSLEVPQYRRVFASNTTFFLGLGGQTVLRAWLVFQLTGSELKLGLVSAAVAIPMLLVAPLGGAIADRIDRRTLVAIGQAMVVVGETIILVLLLTDTLRFWHLLVMATVMGSAFPIMMPARQAIIANVVGRGRLSNAMALNMAAVNTTRVLGPAVAGFLIGAVGLKVAYSINVSLYVLALIGMFGVHSAPPPGNAADESLIKNMREGLRYVLEDRLVLVLLFFGLVPMFLVMPFQNLLVVFTEKIWKVGPEGLGIMSAAAGVGGLIGAILVAWRSESTRRLGMMMFAVCALSLFLVLFAISPWYWLALPMILIANVFAILYSALNNTAIQVLIPDELRGRVSSFLMMSFSLPLLGTLPVSAVAQVVGAPSAVAGAAVLAVLAAVAFYTFSPSLRQMNERLGEAMRE